LTARESFLLAGERFAEFLRKLVDAHRERANILVGGRIRA
jgi:hypothetical protein